jgi:hypothetical protein
MRKFEDCEFSILFKSSALIDEEPENYLITIDWEIRCLDDRGKSSLVGKMRAFFVDIEEAAINGDGPYFVLDLEQATEPFYSVLFDARTNDFKESIYDLAGEVVYSRNLLILDRLEILPAYRGRRLGLACLYRCMQQHRHGAGLVALKCFPLQFEHRVPDSSEVKWHEKMEMEGMGKVVKSCRSKLTNYYSLLGFEKVGRTEFMILNPDLVQPRLKDLNFR